MRNFKDICALVFGGSNSSSSSSLQTYAIVKRALKRALQTQKGTPSSIMTVKYCWELQVEENKSRLRNITIPGNKLQFKFHEVSM